MLLGRLQMLHPSDQSAMELRQKTVRTSKTSSVSSLEMVATVHWMTVSPIDGRRSPDTPCLFLSVDRVIVYKQEGPVRMANIKYNTDEKWMMKGATRLENAPRLYFLASRDLALKSQKISNITTQKLLIRALDTQDMLLRLRMPW